MPERDPNSFGMTLLNAIGDFFGGFGANDPSYGAKRAEMQEKARRQKLEDAYRERLRRRQEQPISNFLTSGTEMLTKPGTAGIEYGPEFPSGFEAPSSEIITKQVPQTIDLRRATLEDLPTLTSLASIMQKEEPGYKAARWGTYDPRTGQPVWQIPEKGKERAAKYARNKEGKLVTYREGELPPEGYHPIEHEPKEKTPKLPLHRDTFDEKTGITWRQEFEDDRETKKGKPYKVQGPAPTKEEKGLTPGKIQNMYSNYMIGRLKDRFDPERMMMEEEFRKEGMTIPERMPELTLDEFGSYLKTGKLPEKKEKPKSSRAKAIEWLKANAPDHPVTDGNVNAVIKKQGF